MRAPWPIQALLSRIVAVLFATIIAADAMAELRVQVEPAWNGMLRAGHGTEVAVRLWDDRTRSLKVGLVAGRVTSSLVLDSVAGEATTAFMPLPAHDDADVRLYVQDTLTGNVLLRKTVDIPSSPRSLVAASPPALMKSLGGLTESAEHSLVAAVPEKLPRTLQGYDAISLLLFDATALHRLDRQQLSALQGHLSLCGRTVIANMPAAARPQLMLATGCGGAALSALENDTGVALAVGSLLSRPADGLVAAATTDLAEQSNRIAREIVAGIAAYAVLLVILIAVRPPNWIVPASAVVVSLLALGYGWQRPEVSSANVLLEMEAGTHVGHYTATLRTEVPGRSTVLIDMPAGAILNPPSGHAVTIAQTHQGQRLRFPASLGPIRSLSFRGAVSLVPPIAMEPTAEGRVLRNTASAPLPAGYAIDPEDGGVRRSPSLRPGQTFLLSSTSDETADLPTALRRSYTGTSDFVMLLPLSTEIARESIGIPTARGWLAIRWKNAP